jgi:uncharacterized paraquat-inducible protein A
MTIRHTLTLNVADIKALEVRCNTCSAFVSYPLEYEIPDFLNCPGCGKNLIDKNHAPGVQARSVAISQLHSALVRWNHIAGKELELTFTVDLEPALHSPGISEPIQRP